MKSRKPEIKKSPTYVETGISVAGEAYFKKTLYTHSKLSTGGEFESAGDALFQGAINAESDCKIKENLEVGGKLFVTNTAIFCDPVAFKRTLQTMHLVVAEQAVFSGEALFHKKADFQDVKGLRATFAQGTFREGLMVGGDVLFTHGLQIEGLLAAGGHAYVKQSFRVGENAHIEGAASVDGELHISDVAHIAKNLYVGGEMYVHADVGFKNNAMIKGKLDVVDDVHFHKDMELNGGLKASHAKIELALHSQSVWADKLEIFKDARVGGDIRVGKDIVCHNMKVADELHAKKNVSHETWVAEDAHIDGSLEVCTDAVIKKDLAVGERTVMKEAHAETLNLSHGPVKSGVYHPEITSTANVAYFVAYECQYQQVENVVTVSGRADIEPEKEGAAHIQLSLPVPTKVSATHHLAGVAVTHDGLKSASCIADQITNRCQLCFHATFTDRHAFFFNFTYRIA